MVGIGRIVVLVLVLFIAGIWVGPVAFAEGPSSLYGAGSWRSSRGAGEGKWTVQLTRSGDALSGEISLKGSPLESGKVVGMVVDGSKLTFGVLERKDAPSGEVVVAATFDGLIENSRVTGTYATGFGDEGDWSGVLK